MLLSSFRALRERSARRRVNAASALAIDPGAKVTFRGIAGAPPARLAIGAGSIFEGSIAADRGGAEVRIGRNTFVGGSLLVCARLIEIGDDVLISWGCTITDHHSHAVEWAGRAGDVRDWFVGRKDWTNVRVAPVRIGNRAWIASNAIILPGVTIGEEAVIGAGSVVTRDVPARTVVAGNPARTIRTLPA